MAKQITPSSPPFNTLTPQVYFQKNDFDVLIWTHGYNVIIEKALCCPCKSKGGDNLSNCKNCGGSGWIFINPVQTKAILSSQNQTTAFKDWSEVNMGNVNITVRDIDKLSFMDRITALDGESLYSQTAYPKIYQGILFAFLDYTPKAIQEVFMFRSSTEKLILLSNGSDYTISGEKIILDTKFILNGEPVLNDMTLSLRYVHAPQYYVIDLKRDVITTPTAESKGNKFTQMPISAQGRRAHYVLDRQNYNGDLIYDNSYSTLCVHDQNCNCKKNKI